MYTIEIIGAPIACTEGVKDGWRKTAEWAASQLSNEFGDQVETHYFDLFDPQCPVIPAGCTLPVIYFDGELLSSGGKISMPLIRSKILESEKMLEK